MPCIKGQREIPLHQGSGNSAKLEEGYREMAEDAEHEREGQEWIEALIGDGLELQIPRG
jgi:hypothetical protein